MDALIVGWLVLAVGVGLAAAALRRSGLLWGLLALVLSPLIAGVALLIAGRKRGLDEPSPWTHIRCPTCKEMIRMDATVCRYCGQRIDPIKKS
jgi:hypothetical protein